TSPSSSRRLAREQTTIWTRLATEPTDWTGPCRHELRLLRFRRPPPSGPRAPRGGARRRGAHAIRRREDADVLRALVPEMRIDDGEAREAARAGPDVPRRVLARDPARRVRPPALPPRGPRAASG